MDSWPEDVLEAVEALVGEGAGGLSAIDRVCAKRWPR